jgi:hypothetical protein
MNSSLMMQRVIGGLAGLAGLWLSITHPAAPFWCVLLFLLTVAAALLFQGLWLTALPAVLSWLSFYPWTGNLVWNEYDIALCGLQAGTMFGRECPWKVSRQQLVWFGPLAGVLSLAAVHGWWTLPTSLAADQLSVYTTNSNTLQQLKVVVYGLILVPLISNALAQDRTSGQPTNWRCLELGMLISAVGVAGVTLLERLVTVGLLDFEQELRITGPCMSMHIGDQHVDAYWVLAIPFIFQFRYASRWQTLATSILQALTLYAVFATMSRATIAAAAILILILAVARLTWFRRDVDQQQQLSLPTNRWSGAAMMLVQLALAVILGATLWFSGDAVPKRFADSLGGWQDRTNQWSTIWQSTPAFSLERLIGFGLGSYPLQSRKIVGRVEQPIRLEQHAGQFAVRLHAGESNYFEQLVDPQAPLPWRISFNCSSDNPDCSPAIVVAHKVLLQSFETVRPELAQPAKDRWIGTLKELPRDLTPDSDPIRKNWCPTSLAFVAQGLSSILLSDIAIVDSQGKSVIRNGDFTGGSQHWFFTSDDHVIWRAKNCWLHLLVETGWLGVLAFGWLCGSAVFGLGRAMAIHRSWPACVLACCLIGFFGIAWFGTLIDTPWISILLLVILAAALGETQADAV